MVPWSCLQVEADPMEERLTRREKDMERDRKVTECETASKDKLGSV